MKIEKADPEMKKIEKEILRKRTIPAMKAISVKPLDEESTANIFKAYFNNRMAVIMLMIQSRGRNISPESRQRAIFFIEDLYHHMVCRDAQKRYSRVFNWVVLFLKKYPNVKPVQKQKVMEYLKVIYEIFGIQLRMSV